MNFPHVALHVPSILLPRDGIDLQAWAVIACDQYTSQPQYWDEAGRVVGDNPSTLHLIFPEAYLGNRSAPVDQITRTMHQYLDDGVLLTGEPGFMLVDRASPHHPSRKGLVVALDLESYDFHEGATTLIRASEGTVLERLPPRARIREQAPIEIPHVMVLIDDPERTVIEPLFDEDLPVAYDFDLMQEAGHVRGYHVGEERLLRKVAINLGRLSSPDLFASRYGVGDQPPLLYVMGDGNHSFATAKLVWEELKAATDDPSTLASHPARFALVELVNVHDEGLTFEPIHRLVLKNALSDTMARMHAYGERVGARVSHLEFSSCGEMEEAMTRAASRAGHRIPFVSGATWGIVFVDTPRSALPTGSLQAFFDDCESNGNALEVDYIHGDDTLIELASTEGRTGFLLPTLSKHDLFRTVVLDGALPRKTFSMGDAAEKRFYLECRKIVE